MEIKMGLLNSNNDDDVLYTMATYLDSYGYTENDFKKAIKNYYENEDTVKQIMAICQVCTSHYQTIKFR